MTRNHPPTFLTLPLELRLEIYDHLLVLPPPPPRAQPTIYRCSSPYTRSTARPSHNHLQNKTPHLHPQILAVSTQTNREATPLLYTLNTFTPHPTALTALPTLYLPSNNTTTTTKPARNPANNINPTTTTLPCRHKPITAPHLTALIRKWHIPLNLNPNHPNQAPPPPWADPAAAVRAALSHADELTLELCWHAAGPFPGRTGRGDDAGAARAALQPFEGVRGVRRARIVGVVGGLGLEGYVLWLEGRMMRERGGTGKRGAGYG